MQLHIGIDDFDSPYGMCTTYFGALIVEYLRRLREIKFLDYPYLIRLNPNIPFKTRGNGAVSLHLNISEVYLDGLIDYLYWGIQEYAELLHGKSDPVIIISKGEIPSLFREIYKKALRELVPYEYVLRLLKKYSDDIEILYLKKGRGVVGAVASIGAYKLDDFTYELLLYRGVDHRIIGRKIREDLLLEIDRKYRPYVFANFDYSKKRLLAISHGPDPVLLGIRAINPFVLVDIFWRLIPEVRFERVIIYKSNQGTNAHLKTTKKIKDIRPYDSVVITGEIVEDPVILKGGHVILKINDGTGTMMCSVYKQTGKLNRVAKLLKRGDYVEIGGGVIPFLKHGMTLNTEYIRVIKVKPIVEHQNPLCPVCGSRMKSSGKNKGFKCPKCGHRSISLVKEKKITARIIEPGLYIQSPIAYRHLTRPLELYGTKPKELNVSVNPLIFL
ncbi:MAG: tRNA(Ile2) 2-agmatinylcytidine synthetase [Thermoprotei archaeon]|nr:MAG: tRNA(Ile2) 2-agmatinylcytidine synthetase [Thermoprotei archaeon]